MTRRKKVAAASTSQIFFMLGVLAVLLVFYGGGTTGRLPGMGELLFILTGIGAAVGVLIVVFMTRMEKARVRAIKMSEVDGMGGVEFEKYIGALMEQRGFKVQFTKATGDFGIDILASKEGQDYAIQIKRYGKPVDRKAVGDAVLGMAKYRKSAVPVVITNNRFTTEAKEVARLNSCILIDRDRLSLWILEFQENKPTKGRFLL